MGVGLSVLVSCVGAMDVIGALGYITNGLVRRNNGYDYSNDETLPDDENLDAFRDNLKESIGNAPTSRVEGVTVAQDGTRYKDGYRLDDNIDGKKLDALNDRLKSLNEFVKGDTEIPAPVKTTEEKPKTPESIVKTPEPKTPTPEPKAITPELKPKTPEPKEKTPEPKTPTSELKPNTPEPKEKTPEPKTPTPELKPKTPEPKEKTPEPKAPMPELKPQTPEPKEKTPDPKASTPELKPKTPEPKEKTPEPENTFKPLQPEPNSSEAALKSPSPIFIPPAEDNKEKEDQTDFRKTTNKSIKFLEEAKAVEERNRATQIETAALQKSSPEPATACKSPFATIKIDEDIIPIAVAPELSAALRPQTPLMEVTEPECIQRTFKPHFEGTREKDSTLLHVDDGEQASGSGLQRPDSPRLRPIVRDDEFRRTKRSSFKSTSSKEDREEELKALSALEDEEMKELVDFVPITYSQSESDLARHHPFSISPIMEVSSYATTSSETENMEETTEKIPDMKRIDIAAPWSPQVQEIPKTFDMFPKSKQMSIEEVQEEGFASEGEDEELKEIERRQETQKWLNQATFAQSGDANTEDGARSKRSLKFPTLISPTHSSEQSSPNLEPAQEPTDFEPLGANELKVLEKMKQNTKALDQLAVHIRRERSRSPEVTDDHIKSINKPSEVDPRVSRRDEFLNEIRNNKRTLNTLELKMDRQLSRSRSPSPEVEIFGNTAHRFSPTPMQSPTRKNVSTESALAKHSPIVPEIRLQDINAFTKQFDNNDDKETEAELRTINFGDRTKQVGTGSPQSSTSSNSPQRDILKKSKSNLKELVTSHRELQVDDDLPKGLLSPRLLSPGFAGSRSPSPSGRTSRSKSREPDYSDWYEQVFEPTIRSVSMERELDEFDDDDNIADEIFDEPEVDDPGPLVIEKELTPPRKMDIDVSEEYCNDPQVQEFASYIKRLTKADMKTGQSVSASFIATEVMHASSSTSLGTIPKDLKSTKKDEETVEYYWKAGAKQVEPVVSNPTVEVVLKNPPPVEEQSSTRPIQLRARRNSIIIPRTTMIVIDENMLYQEQKEEEEYRMLWGTHSPPRRSTTPEIYTSDSDYQHMQAYSNSTLRRTQPEESLNRRRESIDSIIIPRFVNASEVDDYMLLQEEREAEEYRENWGITIDSSRRNTTPAVYTSKGDQGHANANEKLRKQMEKSMLADIPGTPANSRNNSVVEIPEEVATSSEKKKKRRKSLKDSAKKSTLAPTEENKPSKRSRSPMDPNLDYIGDSLFPYGRK